LSYLEASSPGTGGFIDTPNQRLVLWHVLPISSPEELAQVPIEGTDGVVLGDVVEVVEDHQPLIGDAVIKENPNLLLVIEKLPETNILQVTRGLESALDALKPGLPGMDFDATLFRPASFIEMALTNLSRIVIVAAILMVVVLGIFLYNWRTTLISLVVITLSIISSLVVLYMRGSTINVMVLAGLVIALGIIVDDGIVDIQNIVTRLRKNQQDGNPESTEKVILDATAETRWAIFFATLIILLASLPIFFIEGVSGSLLQQTAISYALAVSASLIVALTLTPALSLFLLSNTNSRLREFPLIPIIIRGYKKILEKSIKYPTMAGVVIVLLIIIACAVVPFIGKVQIIPPFKESYLTIQVESAPATSQPEMNRIISRMSSEIRTIPGVQNVGSHIGRAVFGDQVVGINSAELWISLDPKLDYFEITSAIQDVVDGYPGLASDVGTYLQQILEPAQMNTNQDITLRVYGEELDILSQETDKLMQSIAGLSGIEKIYTSLPSQEPTLEIEVDLDVAQNYGIKPGDVRRTAATLISGLQVGSLFEEQKVFDVVVWGIPEIRNSLTKIKELLIPTPAGGTVKLGEIADVRIVPSPLVIRRESVSPYLDINVNVKQRDADAVIADIKGLIQNYHFPLEYHAEVISSHDAQQETQLRILLAVAVAMAGIYLLLQAFSRSWLFALILLLILFASLGIGLIAVYFSGNILSLISIFGLLAILGVGVRNSVLMINSYQNLEEKQGLGFGKELILIGSQNQVVPLLLSNLTTGLILLTFIVFGNISGQEIVYQLAIVILCGLVVSALLNLFALPALYLRYGSKRESDLGIG
jgi:Cu/Ag efflux pump CusA